MKTLVIMYGLIASSWCCQLEQNGYFSLRLVNKVLTSEYGAFAETIEYRNIKRRTVKWNSFKNSLIDLYLSVVYPQKSRGSCRGVDLTPPLYRYLGNVTFVRKDQSRCDAKFKTRPW